MGETIMNRQLRMDGGSAVAAESRRTGTVAKVAFIGGLRGEQLRDAVAELSREELLGVLTDEAVSRVVAISIVSRIEDADLLADIAVSGARTFIRRDALQRLDVLQERTPLTRRQLTRLTPCLYEGALLPWTVALMDAAGFDWCARSDEAVAQAMCAALYSAQGIQEEVIVDDAFAQLAHCRPDLVGSLRACSPERFLPQALQPSQLHTITLIDVTRRDNVA